MSGMSHDVKQRGSDQPIADPSIPLDAQLGSFDARIKLFPGMIYRDENSGYVVVTKESFLDFQGPNQQYLENTLFIVPPGTSDALQAEATGSSSTGGKSTSSFSSETGTAYMAQTAKKCALCDPEGNIVILTPLDPAEHDNVESKLTYRELPMVPQVEYLASLPDGRAVCVTSPKFNYSYEGFRAYLGVAGDMQELRIQHVERYRDGGTTYVHTDQGVLFFPFGGKATYTPTGGTALELTVARRDSEAEEAAIALGLEFPAGGQAVVAVPRDKAAVSVAEIKVHAGMKMNDFYFRAAMTGLQVAEPVTEATHFESDFHQAGSDGYTFIKDGGGTIYYRFYKDPKKEWKKLEDGARFVQDGDALVRK